jgi:acetyltransferase-like isoleucine patch superfamily enzyme
MFQKGRGTIIYSPEKSVILDCKIGKNCTIHAPVWIGNYVKIGDRCKIEAFAFIPEGVTLEDDVFIGPHVCFTNDKHPPSTKENWLKTKVRKGVSIEANATILPGITIGIGAVVGAGAVVTKSVLAHQIWIGNPAHKIITVKI